MVQVKPPTQTIRSRDDVQQYRHGCLDGKGILRVELLPLICLEDWDRYTLREKQFLQEGQLMQPYPVPSILATKPVATLATLARPLQIHNCCDSTDQCFVYIAAADIKLPAG
jgi:hypothetical protein